MSPRRDYVHHRKDARHRRPGPDRGRPHLGAAGAGDRPSCFGHRATIVGSSGDDHLQGTDGNDVIVGRGGKDTIDHLHHGTDYVCGNGGNDNLKAKESEVARVSGGRGFDVCEVEPEHGDQVKSCEQVK